MFPVVFLWQPFKIPKVAFLQPQGFLQGDLGNPLQNYNKIFELLQKKGIPQKITAKVLRFGKPYALAYALSGHFTSVTKIFLKVKFRKKSETFFIPP